MTEHCDGNGTLGPPRPVPMPRDPGMPHTAGIRLDRQGGSFEMAIRTRNSIPVGASPFRFRPIFPLTAGRQAESPGRTHSQSGKGTDRGGGSVCGCGNGSLLAPAHGRHGGGSGQATPRQSRHPKNDRGKRAAIAPCHLTSSGAPSCIPLPSPSRTPKSQHTPGCGRPRASRASEEDARDGRRPSSSSCENRYEEECPARRRRGYPGRAIFSVNRVPCTGAIAPDPPSVPGERVARTSAVAEGRKGRQPDRGPPPDPSRTDENKRDGRVLKAERPRVGGGVRVG